MNRCRRISMQNFDYKGRAYTSLKALHEKCAAKGITYACFYSRVKDGWDMDEALSKPAEKHKRRTYDVDGRIFKNLKELFSKKKSQMAKLFKKSYRI